MEIEAGDVDKMIWDGTCDCARFVMIVDGKSVRCAVSREAICDDLGTSENSGSEEVFDVAKKHYGRITDCAFLKISHNRFEKDGRTILIRSGDLK